MSASAGDRPPSEAGTDREGGPHRYFLAIEETFIRLRGAPLLLSPSDWRVAERWHAEGIPLDLVRGCLAEVFAERRARGEESPVRSLRYCAPVVEARWKEVRELGGGVARAAVEPLEIAPRLERLAASLPARLPGRERLAERIRSLAGAPEAVEAGLQELDREMLETADGELDEAARRELDQGVDEALAALERRLAGGERREARRRLRRAALRRRSRLPLLSLFSPEAQAG